MKSALIRRVAPVALAVGIGLGAAGATAGAASPSAVAPATYGSCATTFQGGGSNPMPYNSSEPSFWFSFFVTSFTCSGPNGVAQRDEIAFFGTFVTLNGQFVQTTDFSDAFVRRLAGLPA